ncbi:hypothetical protein [Nannocystis pusilla]|uniref:hypothetical protein n=1 Tax=Nannocystis pusilla TaxID=889268 RepID=UPI003DA2ED0E
MANTRLNTIEELLRRCQPAQPSPGEDKRPEKWIFNPDLVPVGETGRLHQRRVDLAAAWSTGDDYVSAAARIRTREAIVRQDIRAMRAALRNRGHEIPRGADAGSVCSLYLKEFATRVKDVAKPKRKFVFLDSNLPAGKVNVRPEVYQRLADLAADWNPKDNWASFMARRRGFEQAHRADMTQIRSMVRAREFGPIGRDPGHNFEFCQLFLALFCERVEGAADEVADRPAPPPPRGQAPAELKLQPPAPAPPASKRGVSGSVIYSLIKSIDRRRSAKAASPPSVEGFAAFLVF